MNLNEQVILSGMVLQGPRREGYEAAEDDRDIEDMISDVTEGLKRSPSV